MNRPASAPSTPGRSRRKWWKWAAGALLCYAVFGFIILPLIVKWVAVRQLRTQLDREVAIQKLRINPFVLSATIRGLLIKDKDGQPFVSWEEFYANFQLSSFFGKAWVFKEIRLVQPFVRAQMNPDYSMNFSDLVKKFSMPASGPPPPSGPKKPLFLEVGKIEISGAGADFTDLTFNPPFHRKMGPLRLALNELRTDPNSRNPYSFSGTTDAGEKFSWSGYFSLDPLRSGGQLSFEGLLLPKYTQLLQRMVQFQIKDGLIGLRADYQLAVGETNWTAMVTNADFSLESVRLAAPGETENFAELDSLRARDIHADTGARVAGIGEVNVSGGRVAVKRGRETGINLVQMSKPAETGTNVPGGVLLLLKAATNAIAALQSTTNLWSATLDRFDLTNCAVKLEDLANSRPVNLTVDDIAISVRHLSNVPGSNQIAAFSLRWNSNGTAGVTASAAIAPPSADVTVALNSVELAPLSPYLEPFLDLRLLDGKVNVDWKIGFRMGSNGLPEIKLNGETGLEDFATVTGPKDENLVKWKSFRVTGVSANVPPPSAEVKEVALVGFEGGLALETNRTFNVLNVLRAGETNSTNAQVSAVQAPSASNAPVASAQAAQPAATETKPQGLGQQLGGVLRRMLETGTNADALKFSVDTVVISNLMVKFQDRSVQPPAEVSLEQFGGAITGISSDNLRRADARLAGKIGNAGPIEITGKLNPLSSQAPTEMQVTLRDVDLTPGSPYCGRFLGYRLNKGKLNLQLSYQLAQRQLKANNTLMLDQFTFGSKVDSSDATKLPVRLAVALLKDRQGQIKLEVPVEGNLDDPEFRYGKAVLHVLGNIVTKMITSPFTALGSLFGSGSKAEEVSYQDFAPGSSELTAANLGKLDALLRGLEERPGLQLEIEGCAEPAADREGLKKRKLENAMRLDKWSSLRKSEQERQKPDELALLPEDRHAYLEKAWSALARTNSAAARASAPATSAKTVVKQGMSTPLDRRAIGLMKSGQASAPPGELEQNVLATITVSEEDLRQLAAERARRVQQKLLESGRLAPERIVLAETNQPTTNAAMRVYFHLQ